MEKKYGDTAKNAGYIIFARMCGFFTLICFSLLSLFFISSEILDKIFFEIKFQNYQILILLPILVISGTLICKLGANKIKLILNSVLNTMKNPIITIKVLALSFCIQFSVLLTWYLSFQSITDIKLTQLMFALFIITLTSSLPISFGGIGVREYSSVFILGFFSIAPEPVIASILINYSIILNFTIIAGFWYLFRHFKELKQAIRKN